VLFCSRGPAGRAMDASIAMGRHLDPPHKRAATEERPQKIFRNSFTIGQPMSYPLF
jgi:hypothetical protein